MTKEVHLIAAKSHLAIAEGYDKKLAASNVNEKEAFRTVAAQNYFYALTNFIEARLSEKDIHSYNHENRMNHMMMSQNIFSAEIIHSYDEVSGIRGKVAYRAKNGKDYAKLKINAILAAKEIGG